MTKHSSLLIGAALLAAACGGPSDGSDDTSSGSGSSGEEAGWDEGGGEIDPDSISDTPAEPTYTACEPPAAPGCTDCGLRIDVRRRRAWTEAPYRFEILAEGNHVLCNVDLPCDSPEPVQCRSSPGGPQVVVELAGCGGPLSGQSISALRFTNACPTEMRIESYRNDIRSAVQDLEPRYTNGSATARHDMAR